jgi:hypothetical protein
MKSEMTMIIQWSQWRIRSTDFGFQIERKINPTRWVTHTYHNTLTQACQSLLDYRISTETIHCVIDATNTASARLSTARLIKKIDSVANEICEALNARD